MRLAVTSDIHVDLNGPSILDALCARVRDVDPDVLIVAGDIATGAVTYLRTLLALKAVAPEVVVVAGNHDVWTAPEALAKGVDSWARLDRILPALCLEAGVHDLDAGPVILGGIGFAGTLGWYDLSTRDHALDVSPDAYRTGVFGGLRWTDHEYAVFQHDERRMGMEEVTSLLRARLATHLASLDVPRIVAVTHTLPFAAQLHQKTHPGWRFVNAFLGSLPLGQLIAADPRVTLAVAGHTHLGSDLQLGGLRALVSPLGYKKEWGGRSTEEAVSRALVTVDL